VQFHDDKSLIATCHDHSVQLCKDNRDRVNDSWPLSSEDVCDASACASHTRRPKCLVRSDECF